MAYTNPADRREYNRQRAARLYAEYVERRDRLMATLFGGKCFTCDKAAGKHFHLHHVEYHETESAYARSGRSLHVRILRVAEAEAHPERFRLLCGRCHRILEAIKAAPAGMDAEVARRILALAVASPR